MKTILSLCLIAGLLGNNWTLSVSQEKTCKDHEGKERKLGEEWGEWCKRHCECESSGSRGVQKVCKPMCTYRVLDSDCHWETPLSRNETTSEHCCDEERCETPKKCEEDGQTIPEMEPLLIGDKLCICTNGEKECSTLLP